MEADLEDQDRHCGRWQRCERESEWRNSWKWSSGKKQKGKTMIINGALHPEVTLIGCMLQGREAERNGRVPQKPFGLKKIVLDGTLSTANSNCQSQCKNGQMAALRHQSYVGITHTPGDLDAKWQENPTRGWFVRCGSHY